MHHDARYHASWRTKENMCLELCSVTTDNIMRRDATTAHKEHPCTFRHDGLNMHHDGRLERSPVEGSLQRTIQGFERTFSTQLVRHDAP